MVATYTTRGRERPSRGPTWRPIHNRRMVVPDHFNWLAWLELSRPEAELLRPLPAHSLYVEQV